MMNLIECWLYCMLKEAETNNEFDKWFDEIGVIWRIYLITEDEDLLSKNVKKLCAQLKFNNL